MYFGWTQATKSIISTRTTFGAFFLSISPVKTYSKKKKKNLNLNTTAEN
jgi:hypothetical protein